MSRADELHKIFEGIDDGKKTIVTNLIDEAVFLETQMQELKKYPHIKFKEVVNLDGEKTLLQKVTAAGKQYREYLQTYTNIIDKLCRIYGKEEMGDEESPLRAFLNEMVKKK